MKILTLPILIFIFLLPLVTGLLSQESWLWIYASLPIALIASFMLVCLPAISRKKAAQQSPVENEEIFDHLFIYKTQKTYITLRKVKGPGKN